MSQETRVPLEVLRACLESMGFARAAPQERIREDELEVVPLLQLGLSTGVLDQAWTTRVGRACAEGMRLIAKVENEAYHARFELPVLESDADQRQTMELPSQTSGQFSPLLDRALLAVYRRQQELAWTEDLVEHVEAALEAAGLQGRPARVPAMCFVDLVATLGFTEECGDTAAALAETLAVLVDRSAREHGGVPVKWLGGAFRAGAPAHRRSRCWPSPGWADSAAATSGVSDLCLVASPRRPSRVSAPRVEGGDAAAVS